MTQPLDQILQAAAEGDGAAWRELVHTYTDRVYALLYRQCGSAELAEELTQATFVKMVRQMKHYRELGRFEAWLFRMAINLLRDELRRQARQGRHADVATVPPESIDRDAPDLPIDMMEQQERHAELRAAVRKLPEADQELLHLRYTAEMSFPQIAQTLDEPLGTVLARGHRALKKLRRLLMPDEAEAAATPTPAPAGPERKPERKKAAPHSE